MLFKDTVQHENFKEENIGAEEAITACNYPEAARILVSIVEKDPVNWRAFNNLGILCWAQKNWNDAYTMFTKSVSLHPRYADALVNLFDAALKLKKINAVLPCLEKACELDPEQEEIVILRDSIRQQGNEIYTSRRAFAIGIYNQNVEDGQKELESGNLNRAMELFLKANDEEGPNAEAFCGLGIVSFHQERFEDAFILFIESIKLNPSENDTYLNLIDAAKACNRTADAKTIFSIYRNDFPELSNLDSQFAAL